MMKRMIAALGGGLALVGALAAQTPAPAVVGAPAVLTPAPALVGSPTALPPTRAPLDAAPLLSGGPFLEAACCPDNTACAVPGDRFRISADYLFAWIFGNRLDPLVTTSPPGTPRAVAGIPSLGAVPLVSGRVNDSPRPGFRLTADYALDPEGCWGISSGFMMTASQAAIFSLASNGTPILARPYFEIPSGAGRAVLVAFPGSSTGAIDIRLRSGSFYQGYLDVTEKLYEDRGCRLDCMLGYRYYRYDEGLMFRQVINPTDPNFVPGTELRSIDHFVTNNYFHGGEVGLRGQVQFGALEIAAHTKVGLGNLHREVKIDGSQVSLVPGQAPAVAPGGVYALTSNIGRQRYDEWSAQPEFNLTVGYRVNSHLRLHVGYTAMMMGNISRAYDQVNFFINPTIFPGSTVDATTPFEPSFSRSRADVWVQTLNLGADITW